MGDFQTANKQNQSDRKTIVKKLTRLAITGALSVLLINQAVHAQSVILNDHPVTYDEQGKLVSWITPQNRAYDQVMDLAWNFLLNDVPRDSNHGNLPAYYLYPYVYGDRLYFPGWPHNPADAFYGFTESALAYYPFSGDMRVVNLAKSVLDYHLANGLTTATDAWASVPYASSDAGSLIYNGSGTNGAGSGDGRGVIEPDKVGELGLAFLKMYLFSGDSKYLTAATNAGNALAANIRACDASAPCDQNISPWPFRVTAANNIIQSEYSAHVTAPIKLFDELIRLNIGNITQMQIARQRALAWMLGATGPIATNRWDGFFEDIPSYPAGTNATNINALDTARYLLLHPEVDPNWQVHVPAIMASIEAVLGETQFGVAVMREQQQVPKAMGSHTARYAAVKALWYEKTGDLAAKEAAYRAFNWATYMAGANGQVIDFPGNGAGDGDSLWWTDGYGDFIQHFMAGMGSVPEWAPVGEDHLLRSTSIVKSVSYLSTTIDYLTHDPNSLETFKLNEAPAKVTSGGIALAQVADLAAQEGWVYDAAAKVMKVRHAASGVMSVMCGGLGCQSISPSLPTPTPTGVVSESPLPTVDSTAGPTAGPPPTPLPSGQTVATFDDLVGQNRVLADVYAGIDWGSNTWFLSAPWGLFPSKSVSFNGSKAMSAVFTFTPAKRLASFDIYSSGASTVTVACDGMPAVQTSVTNQIKTLITNWSGVCGAVTLASSNGWNTNFDNFTFDGGGTTATAATITPVPTGLPTAASTSTPTPNIAPASATATATATSSSTPTVAPSATALPNTPTATTAFTPVEISTLTPIPSLTVVPTAQSTATSIATATATPAPSTPTATWTAAPTQTPTTRPATLTPTRTPTAIATATRTPTPTPTQALTSGPPSMVKFDDATGQNRVLTGQYPSGSITWGTDSSWYLSAPWGMFTTKSVSFNGSTRKSATFTLPTPRKLVSLKVYNGATSTTTVTLQCPGQPTLTANVAGKALATISTGWTGTCTTITLTAANGWDTNFDDLVLQ